MAIIYVNNIITQHCGNREYQYLAGTLLLPPYSIEETKGEHDWRYCQTCKENHDLIKKSLEQRQKKFPLCCSSHQKLLKIPRFNVKAYSKCDEMCADKVIFSYQHILNNQNKEDWKEDIEDYLTYAINSFGAFPPKCGTPLFLDAYIFYLKNLIHKGKIKRIVKNFTINFLNNLNAPVEEKDPFLEILKIYDKWLAIFPFDMKAFKGVKERYEGKSPLQIRKTHFNKYSGATSVTFVSAEKLAEQLLDISKELLSEIDLSDLKDVPILQEHLQYFITKTYKNEIKTLTDKIEGKQFKFEKFIDDWLDIQKKYVSAIVKTISIAHITDSEVDSYKEAMKRIKDFKSYIEDKDGYRILQNAKKISEGFLQSLFFAMWGSSKYDCNREVSNGRGSADFVISMGANNKTIIEFKLASNSSLEQNLKNQVEVYQKANNTSKGISVIFCMDKKEFEKVKRIKNKIKIFNKENIIIIDCSPKASASKVRT